MPPKKRGTRASKRKAEPEAAEAEGEAAESQEEEAMEEDNNEASEEAESGGEEAAEETTTEQPPEKKAKTSDDEEEPTAAPEATEAAETEAADQISEEEKQRQAQLAKEEAERKAKQAKEEAERKAQQEKEEKEKAEKRKELDKYWKAVKDDPTDFTGWTYLLQFVDSKNLLEEGREAFDAFLTRYPFCYGYWKKYSDFEKRNSTPEKVQEVFSRGIKAIPLSVDLWLHYINYVKNSDKKEDQEYVRAQYDKAIEACGRDFRSDKLWDSYLKYEVENKNLKEAYGVYSKLLKTPTSSLTENFDKFREFVKTNHPKDLMDSTDFLSFRKEILTSMKEGKGEEEGAEEDMSTDAQEEAAPGAEGAEFEGSEKEITAMKEHLIFSMKKIFKETEKIHNIRVKFESKIKRPYFHVKPLERSALVNWNEYLDYMKKSIPDEAPKDFTKEISVTEEDVEIIYERCLIACALYEEFWLSYINWLESREGDMNDKIRTTFAKACTSHLANKINIHLRWAMFEEIQGDFNKAAEILENLERAHPELTSVKLRRVNLERRRGDDEKATSLFEACMEATQEDALNADCAIKFSRYLRLHKQDTEKAKDVLDTAIEQHSNNIKLRLQMLDLLIHKTPMNVREITEFFDSALRADFKASQKLLLSQRKLEFLEDFGHDAEDLKKAQEEHVKLTKELKPKVLEEEGTGGVEWEANGAKQPDTNANKGSGGGGKFNSFPPVSNTPNYTAQQNMAYQNNAGRYGTYPQGNYPMQYGAGYTGY